MLGPHPLAVSYRRLRKAHNSHLAVFFKILLNLDLRLNHGRSLTLPRTVHKGLDRTFAHRYPKRQRGRATGGSELTAASAGSSS